MKERIIWIDQLKGIAILLVVIGHILWFPMGFGDVGINKCLLLNFIYSFHMPLFIFLSGIVISSVPNIKKLLKKLCQFLCPLLAVGLLYSCYLGKVPQSFFFSSTKLGYWYLWMLSEFYILYYILYRDEIKILNGGGELRKFISYFVLPIVIWIAAKMLVSYTSKDICQLLCLNACIEHWPYFCLGIWCRKFDLIKHIEKINWFTSFALVLYVVAFWLLIAKNMSFHGAGIIHFVFPFTTILFIVIMYKNHCHKLNAHVTNLLSFFGSHTLDIYIFHYFFIANMNLSFLHGYFADSLNTILLAFFSLVVSILVGYSSIFIGKVIRSMELSKIVYGNFFNK